MALKYRFNLKDIKLEDFKVYLVAMFKGILPKKKIKNVDDLKEFIQQKSAWVSQVTLYNYLKTRMGTKWVLHFDDETFLKSINTAKWNIYAISLQDLSFYTISYLNVFLHEISLPCVPAFLVLDIFVNSIKSKMSYGSIRDSLIIKTMYSL